MENLLIIFIGAAGYGAIEILWRGFTHWTMELVGGICFFLLYKISYSMKNTSLMIRSAAGAAVITTLELISGVVINIFLGMNVWDYSGMRFNFHGQICAFYSLMWFFLSMGGVMISDMIRKKLLPLITGRTQKQ